ncbi:MAG: hypothetical protein FKY71_18430 [Spiribacter salinus]|uniref:Uncharacterized protein n=1 Tax=Spiribacter salinus TaxID=1335746 RepID=A0A540V8N1_9GAMM|nr:MAG: hypothetical protein FKY71_18430 [Spiribacter salinus]
MPWVDDDTDSLTLDPPLALISRQEITLQQMQEMCLLLGIDPDVVLRGGQAEIPDIPPWPEARQAFDLVVENAEAYDIASWPLVRVRAVLAKIVAHFGRA